MGQRMGIPWMRFAIVGLGVTVLLMGARGGSAQTVPTPLEPRDGPADASLEVTRDVVYGRIDGMGLVYDVSRPVEPNGAGVVFVVSGGFLSSPENQAYIQPVAAPLLDAGFTIFHLRHPSTPRYLAPEIYEAVKLGRDHILENAADFGVDATRIGVMGMSTGGLLTLLLAFDESPGSSPELPDADRLQSATSDGVAMEVRGADRVAAAVAYMPIVDMRDVVGQVRATPSLDFEPDLAPSLSPIDFASTDDPPTLLVHGVSDTVVPIDENSRRLLPVLEAAGVEADLVEVEGGHQLFTGEDKERADRAVVAWFERFLLR